MSGLVPAGAGAAMAQLRHQLSALRDALSGIKLNDRNLEAVAQMSGWTLQQRVQDRLNQVG